MRRPFLVLALLCFTALAFATNPPVAPISSIALNQFGQPIPYAQIWVCPVTSTGIPCSPTATIYQDYGLTIPLANPFSADQFGNFLAYVPAYGYPNLYTIQISAGQGLYWTYVENGPATGGSGGGCTPTGSPYEILYQYPAVGDCPGDPDFLDYSANLGPLTFTGAGINATVVDNGTFTNGGSFTFITMENGTTSAPNPASFLVYSAMNINGIGGNFGVLAYSNQIGDGSRSGTVNIAGISPNVSSENDSGQGPGYVILGSLSNAESDGPLQASYDWFADAYGPTSNSNVANMLQETCYTGNATGSNSCNISFVPRSDGSIGSGQFNVSTMNLSGNPPVDPTEDSMNFIAYQGKSPINFTAAYTSISSGLRSNSASNTDLTGQVTLSGGTATQPLTGTYASAPNCWVIGDLTTPGFSALISASTTTLTFTGNASDVISYGCLGMN